MHRVWRGMKQQFAMCTGSVGRAHRSRATAAVAVEHTNYVHTAASLDTCMAAAFTSAEEPQRPGAAALIVRLQWGAEDMLIPMAF